MKKIISVFMILAMVGVGSSIFPAITYAIGEELIYGEFIDISDETDVEILPKTEILSIIGETEDKIFEIDTTIGEIDVSYWEHKVNGIKIKNDYILLQEDVDTEEMMGYEVYWRDVSDVSFEFEPSLFEPEGYSWKQQVMFLTENDTSDFYTFHETQEYPVVCWEVRYAEGTTVMYDINGNEIGYGPPAPSEEGFSLSGYDKEEGGSPPYWKSLRINADGWFKKWCGSTVSISLLSPSSISSYVCNPNYKFFYELAHGNQYQFRTDSQDSYYYADAFWEWNYDVHEDLADREKYKFAFIGSCGGMDSTGQGTFSYEFRKGQMENTVTVGYSGMGSCPGWNRAFDWQNYMFEKIDEGNTIKHSFDLASARYPTIASCVVFVGDPNLKIVGNLDVWTNKETYSVGENVTITLENNEDETVYFSTTSHWSIQKNVNGNWETIIPKGVLPQMITQLDPGEKEESTWNQRDEDGAQVGPGDYRVEVVYSMDSWKYTFGKYAYFSIGGNVISPLCVYTDKSIYAPDENVGITIRNIGTDILSLKKWYIEEKMGDGIWTTIYESSRFFYYVVVPTDETSTNYTIAVPYNDTQWTIANISIFDNWAAIYQNESTMVLPNVTVDIWSNTTFVLGNGLVWNENNSSETDEYVAPEIEIGPTIFGDTVEIQTFELLTTTNLQPGEKLTWTWSQITSDGEKPGFGNYRVKVEYDDNSAISSPFSITVILTISEKPMVWTPSLNLTYNLTTYISIGKINIRETPSITYNLSAAAPVIETILDTGTGLLSAKIITNTITDETTIETNNVVAKTRNLLTVNNSSLLMLTSLGYKNIKIMPDMAKEKTDLKSVKSMELIEFNKKPVYQLTGIRESKLLWFIPVDMDATVYVNAENGAEEKMEKPWWGFLAS